MSSVNRSLDGLLPADLPGGADAVRQAGGARPPGDLDAQVGTTGAANGKGTVQYERQRVLSSCI